MDNNFTQTVPPKIPAINNAHRPFERDNVGFQGCYFFRNTYLNDILSDYFKIN